MRRRAMRDLHAGHGNCRGRTDPAASLPERRGNPRRTGGESLPLHRVPENLRGCRAGLPNRRQNFSGVSMRSYVPGYDLQAPENLSETLALLEREPGVWKPFAGGTDLMVLLEAGKLSHK